ncbi:MAG: hypothetical protein WA840_24380 [Caulobacteraceae bacterium]
MSSALVIASLSAALLAQAGAAQINQIGGATGPAATVQPLEAPSSGSSSVAGPTSAPLVQVGPEGLRSTSAAQLGPANHDTAASDQLGKRDRNTSATQLTNQRRTASAPPALSSVREGYVVSTVVVHGHDRCNPEPNQPLPADCAHIVDQRPDDFAAPPPPELTPDEMLLVLSPPATRSTQAANGLTGGQGGDEAVSAAMAGFVTQSLPSSTASAPTLGTSVNTAINAPTSALPAGVGATGGLPAGIVVTVTPAPK